LNLVRSIFYTSPQTFGDYRGKCHGLRPSKAEGAFWIKLVQMYIKQLQDKAGSADVHLTPVAAVVHGIED
jgi:hypothetical protein